MRGRGRRTGATNLSLTTRSRLVSARRRGGAMDDKAVVSGVDSTRKRGVIKWFQVSGPNAVEMPAAEVLLEQSHPFDFDLGVTASGRHLYVLDTLQNRIVCLRYAPGDFVPFQTTTYAQSATFPVVSTALSIGVNNDGTGRNVLLTPQDLKNSDAWPTSVLVDGLFDDDGDCVADRQDPVLTG